MFAVELPRISRKEIRARIGEERLQKGETYAADGSVFDTKRQGSLLKARVQGREFEPYRVLVRCDETGVAASECSCPVGGGGYCKHVAAVLLVWMRHPDLFLEVEDLGVILERWDRDELIALIQRMVRRAPELEILLETPSAGVRNRANAPIRGADFYQRQAETAFRLAGDGWRASLGVAQDLEALRCLGDELLQHDDIESAAAVYQGSLAGILRHYGSIPDEEGDIGVVAGECGEGLGKCLSIEPDPARRSAMLRVLFDFYRFDVEQGGYGLADEVPGLIVELVRNDERTMVAGWIRELLDVRPKRDREVDVYRRRVWGAFLLDLEAETLDDDAYLRICRETGRSVDAIERLLDRGRVDEAQAETAGLPIHETLDAADLFARRDDQADWAEAFVRDRLERAVDASLLRWLKHRAIARRNRAEALELARRIFRKEPTFDGYRELRKLAGPHRWPSVRSELLDELATIQFESLRIEIALAERDYARAVELAGALGPGDLGRLVLRVADAVARRKPEAAIRLYCREAERQIARQGRASYREACRLLGRIRKLHRWIQDEDGWITYRNDLLTRYRRLRAFQDEFQTARLDR